MKLLVVSLGPRHADVRPGDTIHLRDGAVVVVATLPQFPGRPAAVRVTSGPPCGLCEGAMRWDTDTWRCRSCGNIATAEVAGAAALESLTDQGRAGKNRRRDQARARQANLLFDDSRIRSRTYKLLRDLSRAKLDHETAQLAATRILRDGDSAPRQE